MRDTKKCMACIKIPVEKKSENRLDERQKRFPASFDPYMKQKCRKRMSTTAQDWKMKVKMPMKSWKKSKECLQTSWKFRAREWEFQRWESRNLWSSEVVNLGQGFLSSVVLIESRPVPRALEYLVNFSPWGRKEIFKFWMSSSQIANWRGKRLFPKILGSFGKQKIQYFFSICSFSF